MRTDDLVLIPFTEHGVPSGNYDGSSLDFDGNKQPAANYYRRASSTQTVYFNTTDFVGTITVQATLDDPVDSASWFDVYSLGDGSTAITVNTSTAITGNFTWMRVSITDFNSGTITGIALSY